jgi:hypothetical protein
MDNTVLVALISAGGAVLAAFIAILPHLLKNREQPPVPATAVPPRNSPGEPREKRVCQRSSPGFPQEPVQQVTITADQNGGTALAVHQRPATSSHVLLLDRVLREIAPDTVIPKPAARAPFKVKGEGRRRGERALIYKIPNHGDPKSPHEKGVTASELERAHEQLVRSGRLTRDWFDHNLPACRGEGTCNFTTIGGLFILLGEAEYVGPGVYRRCS